MKETKVCQIPVIGNLSNDEGGGCENVTLRSSNLHALIPSRLICQILVNFSGVEFLSAVCKFRKRNRNSLPCIDVLHRT